MTKAYQNFPAAPRFAPIMRKLVLICGLPLLILLLAAFSPLGRIIIVATMAPSNSTPGVGPTVILSPTLVPDQAQAQLVTLSDRTLVISNVSKVAGADSSSTGISITISVQNTGTKSILNQASFYQLMVAEGDTFGLQAGINSNFFGSIPPGKSLKGTLVFQVPTAALGGIQLLFRSEIATETVFILLKV